MSSSDPDEFDRIVEHLDLDLSFPDTVPEPDVAVGPEAPAQDSSIPGPGTSWTRGPDSVDDEYFYRRVDPQGRPLRPKAVLAWVAVLGGPAIMVLATMSARILPRTVVAGLVLLFVAGAVYLFSQLPERGPSDPDSPDDGAVL